MRRVLLVSFLVAAAAVSASGQWLPSGSTSDTDPIERTGNVSVGTNATPLNKLYVYSTSSADGLSVDGTNNPSVVLRSSTAVKGYGPGIVTQNGSFFSDSHVGDMIFRSESNNILFGRGSGASALAIIGQSIGIGTGAPAAKLDVDAGSAASNELRLGTGVTGPGSENKISFALGSGNVRLAQISGLKNNGNDLISLHFRTIDGGYNLQDRLTIADGGNVGLGTTAPAAKLDIDSGAAASNELRLGTGPSGAPNSENLISFALGSGNVRLAQISSLKNSTNDLTTVHFRTIDGLYHLQDRMTIGETGNVGIGTTNPSPSAKLDVNGNVNVTGTLTATTVYANYQDVAEWVPAAEEMAAGTVVIVSGTTKNTVVPSHGAYDTRVAGVVSAQPGLILGEASPTKARIATTGRVRVRVDATRTPIAMGDLLVTSERPGTAMKSEPLDLGGVKIHRPGTLIGKALEPLGNGEGEILVLLSLQ